MLAQRPDNRQDLSQLLLPGLESPLLDVRSAIRSPCGRNSERPVLWECRQKRVCVSMVALGAFEQYLLASLQATPPHDSARVRPDLGSFAPLPFSSPWRLRCIVA